MENLKALWKILSYTILDTFALFYKYAKVLMPLLMITMFQKLVFTNIFLDLLALCVGLGTVIVIGANAFARYKRKVVEGDPYCDGPISKFAEEERFDAYLSQKKQF